METVEIHCPYCGEVNAVELEWGARGKMVHDCWVCCRPIELDVDWDEWGDPRVTARREDG